jgi:hypothetical protein
MEQSKNRRTISGILVSAILILAVFTIVSEAVANHASPLVVDADGFVTIESSQANCDAEQVPANAVDGTTTFSSIQDAINIVGPHFIIVCPGTYGALTITENEKIYGFPGAIIDALGISTAVVINGVNSGCTGTDRMIIDGFEITNGAPNGITVTSVSCRVFIYDNDIHDNAMRGIFFETTDHSWIHNNAIHDNVEGIRLENNSNDNFIGSNRIFDHNDDNTERGIIIDETNTPPTSIRNLITQNKLTNNYIGVCLCGDPGASSNTMRGNTATGSGSGALDGAAYLVLGDSNKLTSNKGNNNVAVGFEAGPASSGNIFKKNTANNNGGIGFRDDPTPANTYTGNKCSGNGVDNSDPDLLCT